MMGGQELARSFLQDLRFGFRMLRRSPGFSLLAILCLTLGIGANAAVFSWIEGILFRPYPAVTHQERLVRPLKWKYSATILAFHAPPAAVTSPVTSYGKIPGRIRCLHRSQRLKRKTSEAS